MGILAGALVLVAATAAVQDRTAGDGARLRAEYEKDLARLRQEHEKALAQIRAEAAALEERVGFVRRLTPSGFEADLMERQIQALAKASDMKPVTITRVAGSEKVLAGGRPTPYERFFLEVSGEDGYFSVGYFLERLGRLPLIVELETLSLEAAPKRSMRFAARLAFPCMTGRWETARPPLPMAPPPVETLRPPSSERAVYERALAAERAFYRRIEDAMREPIRWTRDEILALDDLRNAHRPARVYAALARFEAGMQDGRAVFNRARFGPQTVIEGAVAGEAARAALRAAFEGAGLVIEKLDVAAAGGCSTFALSARLKPEEVPEGGVFDIEVGEKNRFRTVACQSTAQPSLGTVTARGTGGPLTASLRDIDVADVFRLLSALGQGSYVVDADVKGRVNVELERATLDEALAAAGSAGVTVGPGPLRRVSRAGTRPAEPLRRTKSWETPINLAFRDGVLLDVVRLFEDISGRKAWTAPVTDGLVTVFAVELPWDTALEGIAASAGLTVVFEDERLFVGPASLAKAPWKSGAVEVAKSRTSSDDEPLDWNRVVEFRKLTAEELTPVGIARGEEGMKALAYGPGRMLWIFQAGDALSDASVDRVDATGVTFAGRDGHKNTVRFAP
jgi:Tfp pilus assembly protein PilO